MGQKIKEVYIVHHSHTDVGYTDLQEQVIFNQAHNIRTAVKWIMEGREMDTAQKDLKWNCETWYCVEEFLKRASEEEKADFWETVRLGNMGLSANYLNFNDLTDCQYLDQKLAGMMELCQREGVAVKTAMCADINGISLGQRDALIRNGVEFLYMNIHTHHGMYPLYQNQTPFFWENKEGKRLLVWNGEHYNLGNVLGIVMGKNINCKPLEGPEKEKEKENLKKLYENLTDSIAEYEENGYLYDFYITSVSGVFSDNAPVNPMIADTVKEFNRCYGEDVTLHMVTLQELYDRIREKVKDAPVYQGSMNDWWGNGVGSTPYAVKHFKEALRLSRICDRLEKNTGVHNEELVRAYGDNSLLYAEHTWGHSATISDPYDTMVTNLDFRKNSYASKAHEAAAMRKSEQCYLMGDILRYYNLSGKVKAVSTSSEKRLLPVEFYVEAIRLPAVKLTDDKTGEVLPVQLSSHPRGILVSFLAEFEPLEEKIFTYEEQPEPVERLFTRTAWIGAERVKDIVNDYDTESCYLPYGMENKFFRISWKVGEGIRSFYNKTTQQELCKPGLETFFTPVYERTEIRKGVFAERSRLGRNIRGLHAKQYQGILKDVKVLEHGAIFTKTELLFELEGTYHSSVILKMYRDLPRIEFTYRVAKTLNEDVESLYLPLSLNLPDAEIYVHNAGVSMRPGIDQLPGTNMEYYMADEGLIYQTRDQAFLVNTLDTALLYMGEMESHPILLCDRQEKNNHRPVYSWIMNNTWETNFKMDLSGYCEFRYSIELIDNGDAEKNLGRLEDNNLGVVTFITRG